MFRRNSPRGRLSLLATRPVLLGSPSPRTVCDYWGTPLLKGEARKMVEGIQLIEPPVRMIMEGVLGPRVVEQQLALVTFGACSEELPTPSRLHWADCSSGLTSSSAIVVDFPSEVAEEVINKLATDSINNVQGWSRPMPSA
eukprot:9052826-Pyramimonas_sp.AAC.1